MQYKTHLGGDLILHTNLEKNIRTYIYMSLVNKCSKGIVYENHK